MRQTALLAVLLFFVHAAVLAERSTSGSLSVCDFGADTSGKEDCTSAFQKAMDQCAAAGGGSVTVPSGRYLFRGHLTVPAYVCLKGTFEAPPTTTMTSGSVLLATEGRGNVKAEPFILLQRCSTLRGLEVFYPEQRAENIVEYPWCVRGFGDDIAIRDVLLVNPFMAVDFGTFPAGRHFISGLYGHPLKLGLFIDKCFDVGRVENVHFWPFWTEAAMEYTRLNGTAFKIAKTDWEYMRDCFCISYAVGYHFTQVKDGPGNAVLTQCGSDVGPLAVKVDAVQPHAGVSFENGQFMAGIEVADSNSGPVKFTSCGFWGVQDVTESHARIAGAGHVTFTACHFTAWDQKHTHAAAIVASSGGLTVNGCEFLDTRADTHHIELNENVEAAIIQGNRFRVPPVITNHSEGEVLISNNTSGKKTGLQQALRTRDADQIAKLWSVRMQHTPLTSAPESLRLGSAVAIGNKNAEVRTQLLKSITAQPTAAHNSFEARARRELALDAGRMQEAGPVLSGVTSGSKNASQVSVTLVLGDGTPATFQARYDSVALYFHAQLEEPRMKAVRAKQTRHDGQIWTDDSIELFLAPHGDVDEYYQLIVNSNSAVYDGRGNQRSTSAAWDSGAEVKTNTAADRWTVDLRLPWKSLSGAPKAGDRWGIDVRRWRYAGGSKAYESWAKAPLGGDTHHPESFGFLLFK